MESCIRREASRLLHGLHAYVEAAQSQVMGSARTGGAELAAESAVSVIASLDAAYYVVLEHHLSCGHETPAVPPPHDYLPAIVAANPGRSAVQAAETYGELLAFLENVSESCLAACTALLRVLQLAAPTLCSHLLSNAGRQNLLR